VSLVAPWRTLGPARDMWWRLDTFSLHAKVISFLRPLGRRGSILESDRSPHPGVVTL
jgi:hypothetical protein